MALATGKQKLGVWAFRYGRVALYGFIPTLQPAHFGRVYAAYGGVFIILSMLWGWKVDGIKPDAYDLTGALLALAGVAIMMYWPRGS